MAAKKTKKKAKRYNSALPRWQLWGVGFCATFGIALLSFISLPLGGMAFAIVAAISITYAERRRRDLWERSASFKFKNIEKALDDLSYRAGRNKNDIGMLSQEVQSIQLKAAPSPSPKTDISFSEYLNKSDQTSVNTSSPRAIKPGRAPEPASPPAREPDPNAHIEEYDHVSDTIVKELLHMAVERKRIDVFVQPVVRLPQRQVRFYEMYARIRAKAGLYLPAGRYMSVAEQDNLDAPIDHLLLLHCLKTIEESAEIEKAAPFFLNINAASLKNGAFMKRLLAFLSKNRDLAPRLIFEIEQYDFEMLSPAVLEIVRGLGALGCSFSLDHITDAPHLNIQKLQRHKVRYVKLRADAILDSNKAADLLRCKRLLESNGIGVIIERIETEEQMRKFLDYDLHYGQGYLFGKPDLQGAYKNSRRVRRSHAGQDEEHVA